MTKGITIKRQFHVRRGRSNRRHMIPNAKPKFAVARVPRISRLMALAIRFDQLIRDGVVADQADLAKLGHVSRPRLTQIMNLLNLAPDIQVALLDLAAVQSGPQRLSERTIRPIAAKVCWIKQRQLWNVKKLGVDI